MVHNGTRRAVRLLGGVNSCGPTGCATVRGLAPGTIPAGLEFGGSSIHFLPGA